MVQLSRNQSVVSLDEAIAYLGKAYVPDRALSLVVRLLADRWSAAVVLAVHGNELRPVLSAGDVAHADALGAITVSIDGDGPLARAARSPVILAEAEADPLVAELLVGERTAHTLVMSVSEGFGVRYVLVAARPTGAELGRGSYALLLHALTRTLTRRGPRTGTRAHTQA